jgi:hypothetical protein
MGVYMVEQPRIMEKKMQEAILEAENTLQRLKEQVKNNTQSSLQNSDIIHH